MSESEEMYLVTVAMLEEAGVQPPVQVSMLAKELSIQPVSANQMIRRLEDAGMVTYTPYKGVELTELGKSVAMRVLRHRRLWEVFLVNELEISADTASELACQMEHVVPAEVMSRLAAYLGEPSSSPEGKQIPAGEPETNLKLDVPLIQLKAGERGAFSRFEADEVTRSFLTQEGIRPGAILNLLGLGGNGNLLVEVDRKTLHLTSQVAEMIWVNKHASLS